MTSALKKKAVNHVRLIPNFTPIWGWALVLTPDRLFVLNRAQRKQQALCHCGDCSSFAMDIDTELWLLTAHTTRQEIQEVKASKGEAEDCWWFDEV